MSHLGQGAVIGAGLGVLFGAPAFAGAVAPFPRGAEGGHAARRRRKFGGRAACGGLRYFLQVGVRACVLLLGVSFAASESQRADDLVCSVQRRRSGACFAWGRGFRRCCVAVPKSRGWAADFPWLVHLLWARRGVGGGARTAVLWAGIRVCVWALSPLRLPSSWGLSGPAAHVLWARVCGYGVQRCPRGPYSLCSSGAGSLGFAARVSVVRGICGQALPLPRLSALWAGCRGPSSTLAVGAAVRVWGPGAVTSACMPCGGRAPWGWWGPSPGGWPAIVARGVWCQALSLPRSSGLWAGRRGSATHMLWARVCGCGGPALSPRVHALWELRAAGVVGGHPRGGGLPPL